jgi:hypothetical protein
MARKSQRSPQFWRCKSVVRQIAGENLTDSEIDELADVLMSAARAIRAERYGMTADEAVDKALRELSEDLITEAKLKKRNTYLINSAFTRELGSLQSVWADDLYKGIEVMLVGSNIARRGSQRSVDADQKGLANEWSLGFHSDVERTEKQRLYAVGDLDLDVYKALGELYKDDPNWTGIDRDAREFADIVFKYQELIRVSAIRAGAWTGKLPDFITHQSHDQFKVRTAAIILGQQTGLKARLKYDEASHFKAWKEFVLPKIDEQATFRGIPAERREGWLKAVFVAIGSGEHMTNATSSTSGFSASGSLAARMSQQRILHFKDANARFEYDQRFGRGGSLYERVSHQLHTAAHNVALMRRLGPNPQEVYNRLKNAAQLLTEQSIQARSGANSRHRNEQILDAYFREVTGEANQPGVDPLSTALRSMRLLQTVSKLGGAMISSIADTAVATSELRYQGFSALDAWATQLDGIFSGYGARGQVRADRLQLASELGIAIDLLRSATWSRFSAEDAMPGWAARAQHTFFKMNGLMWWTDTLRMANAQAMSHRIATFADRSLPELDSHTQNLFKIFDITADEWDLMRTRSVSMVEGKEYLTPMGAKRLTDVEIAFLLNKEGTKATTRRVGERRDLIQTKFRDLFSARSDYAVITPGPRARSFMTASRFGAEPGTLVSEIARSLSQFKGFPASIIERVWGREIFGYGESGKMSAMTSSGMRGMAKFMVFSTFLGLASMWLKAYFNGRRIERPENGEEAARLFVAAFLQGGGAGLYGDFLLSQAKDRYGHAAWESLLGPSVPAFMEGLQTAKDMTAVPFDWWFDRMKEGDNFWGDAFFAFKNNAPFINLFYTRMALDYMILYELQELAAPGSLKRAEKNFKDNLNQSFAVPPSQKSNVTDFNAEDFGTLLNPF